MAFWMAVGHFFIFGVGLDPDFLNSLFTVVMSLHLLNQTIGFNRTSYTFYLLHNEITELVVGPPPVHLLTFK